MRLASDRPLVGVGKRPGAVLAAQAHDVLNDAGLLIVGLFDKE